MAAAVYDVGSGKPYATIGAVPWAKLEPGDRVNIHAAPEPYREKWAIGRSGTAEAPIVVRGIPGPDGKLPVIDGSGAAAVPGLVYSQHNRGIVKIGATTVPDATSAPPSHIVVEYLEFQGARNINSFRDSNGEPQLYASNASGIFLQWGRNITIRGCVFHDNGNGLFVASSEKDISSEVLLEGNYFYDNGNTGSIFHHNVYSAARDIVYQYNRFGPLRLGAGGNNLKDRSAGTVIRYNWIEGGNRQLDLVDAEDSAQLRESPAYRATYVYGNVLIERSRDGNARMIHYGGDSGKPEQYRKGKLYFYNNTVISERLDRTILVQLSTAMETADIRNNIFVAGRRQVPFSLLDELGSAEIRNNWFMPGWRVRATDRIGYAAGHDGNIVGDDPGFADAAQRDYRLRAGSVCLNRGAEPPPDLPAQHRVRSQYKPHQSAEPRPANGPVDLGAFEYAGAAPKPPARKAPARPKR